MKFNGKQKTAWEFLALLTIPTWSCTNSSAYGQYSWIAWWSRPWEEQRQLGFGSVIPTGAISHSFWVLAFLCHHPHPISSLLKHIPSMIHSTTSELWLGLMNHCTVIIIYKCVPISMAGNSRAVIGNTNSNDLTHNSKEHLKQVLKKHTQWKQWWTVTPWTCTYLVLR